MLYVSLIAPTRYYHHPNVQLPFSQAADFILTRVSSTYTFIDASFVHGNTVVVSASSILQWDLNGSILA